MPFQANSCDTIFVRETLNLCLCWAEFEFRHSSDDLSKVASLVAVLAKRVKVESAAPIGQAPVNLALDDPTACSSSHELAHCIEAILALLAQRTTSPSYSASTEPPRRVRFWERAGFLHNVAGLALGSQDITAEIAVEWLQKRPVFQYEVNGMAAGTFQRYLAEYKRQVANGVTVQWSTIAQQLESRLRVAMAQRLAEETDRARFRTHRSVDTAFTPPYDAFFGE